MPNYQSHSVGLQNDWVHDEAHDLQTQALLQQAEHRLKKRKPLREDVGIVHTMASTSHSGPGPLTRYDVVIHYLGLVLLLTMSGISS